MALSALAAFSPSLLLLVILRVSCSSSYHNTPLAPAPPRPLVPAFFLFGDSILDPGNNNHFLTLAKVDYHPYGIDFPGALPTGRFSNGYNAADYLAFKLGLQLIPAYNHPATEGTSLLRGVNFASGGSGIQAYTGKFYGKVVSMEEQVHNFKHVTELIVGLIGAAATNELLAEAAYAIITGSNDWLLSYFFLLSPLRLTHTTAEYRDILVQNLISHVVAIYKAGARKIFVAGLPALGCCPSQLLEYNSNGSCVKHINDISSDFNQHLAPQLMALNNKLENVTIMYINIYTPILNAAQNPFDYSFKTANHACCGIGRYGGFLTCLKGMEPCEDVEEHMYWDAYHPTQKFYPQLIDIIWNNGPPYSHPTSLKAFFE